MRWKPCSPARKPFNLRAAKLGASLLTLPAIRNAHARTYQMADLGTAASIPPPVRMPSARSWTTAGDPVDPARDAIQRHITSCRDRGRISVQTGRSRSAARRQFQFVGDRVRLAATRSCASGIMQLTAQLTCSWAGPISPLPLAMCFVPLHRSGHLAHGRHNRLPSATTITSVTLTGTSTYLSNEIGWRNVPLGAERELYLRGSDRASPLPRPTPVPTPTRSTPEPSPQQAM